MSKQINPNIGHGKCIHCGAMAAARRDKNGHLYQVCLECGRTPAIPQLRQKMAAASTVWPDGQPPAECPRWIVQDWPPSLAKRAPQAAAEPPHPGERPASNQGGKPEPTLKASSPKTRKKGGPNTSTQKTRRPPASQPPPPPKKKTPPAKPTVTDEPPSSWIDDL